MADNPKGLASLADELERYAVEIHSLKGGVFYASRLREIAAALRAPTIAADDAECGWCALEECKECLLRRKDHAGVTTHDYEPAHDYVCAGCPGDVLWDSDNYTEHPGYDHDFDPIPFATPSPTIAALEPLQLTESEAAELDAFRAKPSRAEGRTFTQVPTIAAPGVRCRVCDDVLYSSKDDPAHPSYDHDFETIAAPSPSNEVTDEMVEAALEAFVESENVPDTRHDTEAMRLAIEAALKARKPEDDGAGR